MKQKIRNAPPKAAAMVEALRGLGYTTETALADLIDNSISAGAKRIEINFHWKGEASWIAISDNGRGMSDAELEFAMRLGEKNPLHDRDAEDLGRFGLGLKTASFSQARRLTVFSRKNGETSCLRWDLDVLANDSLGGWHLLEGPDVNSRDKIIFPTDCSQGTIVLWETLDRIITSEYKLQDFLDLMDRVESHLSMVFHRYIDHSSNQIELLINNQKIVPWDPFLSNHPATWRSPETPITNGLMQVVAQTHVLPHKDRLSDKEYITAGGPEGWHSQQGFYIYRGRRLLVAGSWLGLGKGRSWHKDESHRLARIRLDIPNNADTDWKVDIRKSLAHPPIKLREQLTKLAEDVRARARKVFLHRAQFNSLVRRDNDISQVWLSFETASGRRYKVNRSHPGVQSIMNEGQNSKAHIEALLRILEETIPVQRIWLESTETGEHSKGGFTDNPDESVIEILTLLYKNLVTSGMSSEQAKEKLMRTEPFDLHIELVRSLPDNIQKL